MAQALQQVLRLAMLLIGMSYASMALALSTVNVEPTGPQANETTVRLFDNSGKPATPDDATKPNSFSNLAAGNYQVEVFVGGKLVGSRSTITLADGNNRLQVNGVTGAVAVIPSDPARSAGPSWPFNNVQLHGFSIRAGVGSVSDDAPTLAVFPGPDSAVLHGESRIPVVRLESEFFFYKDGMPRCRWEIGGSFGDASTSTEVPNGVNSGWSYWQRVNNSNGLASPFGMRASLKTNYDNFHVNWGLPYTLKREGDGTFYGEPRVGFRYTKMSYDGSLINTAFSDVSSTTNQDVKQTQLGLGWNLGFRQDYANGFSLAASAGVGASYYRAKYDGTQHNVCPPCATALQNFTLSSSGRKSGWAFDAGAEVRAGYKVSKDVELVLTGQYGYTGAAAGVANSPAPANQPPEIVTYGRHAYSGLAGLAFTF